MYTLYGGRFGNSSGHRVHIAGEGGYDMKTNLLPILALKLLFIVLMVWFTEMQAIVTVVMILLSITGFRLKS